MYFLIKKDRTPKGDGNEERIDITSKRNKIKKDRTPKGDGNQIM